MPGIVGLITSKPREWAEPELMGMVEGLWKEPFYTTGTWIDESLGAYVGWSAHRTCHAASMPIRNEDGKVVMVFSGEEYPDPAVRDDLRQRGHNFGREDLSYLVHVYEDDPRFPAGLNGRFHGVVADSTRELVTVFNDRYGMHRLYYHQSKHAFYFAVEAKAILAARPELRSPDLRGLGEVLGLGCVLENRTVFKNIHVLPPGSCWSFVDGNLKEKHNYFSPREWEQQEPLSEEAYYQELKQVFSRNLQRYFNGLEKIGMSLTGGLDTRMIMAWQQSSPGSLPCYSFGDMFRDIHDVRLARTIARQCLQPYEVIPIRNDFLIRFPYYAERTVQASDGCAGVDCAADLYLNEQAAQIAPVRMTGNYGSEVLRSVRAFKPSDPTPGLFKPELAQLASTAADTYSHLSRGRGLSFTLFCQAPWHHYGLLTVEQTQLTVRSPFLDNELVSTVFRAPNSTLETNTVSLRLIADGKMELDSIPTDRGLAGSRGRFTSALSRRLLSFTFKAEYAWDYGMPQWIAGLEHYLSALHPERLFLGRHKFCHFRIWYRDSLSKYVKDMLLDPRTLSRPYLHRDMVRQVVYSHLTGTRNYTTAIHKMLTLELLHRLFLD